MRGTASPLSPEYLHQEQIRTKTSDTSGEQFPRPAECPWCGKQRRGDHEQRESRKKTVREVGDANGRDGDETEALGTDKD